MVQYQIRNLSNDRKSAVEQLMKLSFQFLWCKQGSFLEGLMPSYFSNILFQCSLFCYHGLPQSIQMLYGSEDRVLCGYNLVLSLTASNDDFSLYSDACTVVIQPPSYTFGVALIIRFRRQSAQSQVRQFVHTIINLQFQFLQITRLVLLI